jgi:integrase
MARKGRVDRGLMQRKDAGGKPVWYVRLWHDGKERRFGSFKAKSEARRFYEMAKEEQRQGKFFPAAYQRTAHEPIQAILDDYMLTTVGKRAVKRERDYARWWGRWFEKLTTTSLQPQQIERARLELLKGQRKLSTINRYTDWLRHVLNWALRQKRIKENSVLLIERYQEDEILPFQYSLEQEAKVMEQLNEEEVDLLRLAVLTGLRQNNQFRLRKEQANLGLGIVAIPTTKNRKPRIVHLSEEAKELLRRQMARHLESPWIFPGTVKKDRPLNARWWYNTRFKPACERAGIAVDQIRQLWHALRHTFGSRMASLQYKEKAIMAAGGWCSSKAVQRYLHLYDESMKEAAERLASLKPNGTVTKTGAATQLPIDIYSKTVETKSGPA